MTLTKLKLITPSRNLTLWLVTIPDGSATTLDLDTLVDKTELNLPRKLRSDLFPEPPGGNSYIVMQLPQGNESGDRASTQLRLANELLMVSILFINLLIFLFISLLPVVKRGREEDAGE